MTANGDRFPSGEMEKLWNQIELMVAQHCEWTKCYLKVVKMVNFMLSESYHNFLKNIRQKPRGYVAMCPSC